MTRPVSEILEELEGLREKATDLPWALDDEDASNVISVHPNSCIEGLNTYRNTALAGSPNDAALIVALVNAFPALKEEIERLRAGLTKIENTPLNVDSHEASDDPAQAEWENGEDHGTERAARIARRTLQGETE
tara:strand:- start:21194 stop:21595 length:402 start_codon:yes stop_codon:yes gene_type:complete